MLYPIELWVREKVAEGLSSKVEGYWSTIVRAGLRVL